MRPPFVIGAAVPERVWITDTSRGALIFWCAQVGLVFVTHFNEQAFMSENFDAQNRNESGCECASSGSGNEAVPVLTRRDFVAATMLTAIAATLTACGTGELTAAEKLLAAEQQTPSKPTPTTPTPAGNGNPTVGANQIGVTVASYPALATVGGVARVNASPPIGLARTATGFVAYSLKCPHQGTTCNVVGTTSWLCPNHDATFASTGSWTGGQRTTNLVARTVTANTANTFVVVNLT